MKNRNGTEYKFEKLEDNLYTIVGEFDYWRYGSKPNAKTVDFADLEFVDPSGGPFINIGYQIENRKVIKISAIGKYIFFEVKPYEKNE